MNHEWRQFYDEKKGVYRCCFCRRRALQPKDPDCISMVCKRHKNRKMVMKWYYMPYVITDH